MCLINMVTRESMRSQYALQAKSLHNKYIYGHNLTKMIAIHGLTLRLAHTRGLVPVTSPWNMSQEQVPSCELAIFASKSGRKDHLWSL